MKICTQVNKEQDLDGNSEETLTFYIMQLRPLCTIYTSNPVTELTDSDDWEVFAQASAVKKTYLFG